MGSIAEGNTETMKAVVKAPWRSGHDCPDFLRITANGGMNKLPPTRSQGGRRKKESSYVTQGAGR